MARYFCHDHPEVFELGAEILDSRPGAVLLDRTPAFPGGGGQLADRARLLTESGEFDVTSFEADLRGYWHHFDGALELKGPVQVHVDRAFRDLMCELHTVAHIINNLVFRKFGGALVTGVQMAPDGTFRNDFDLPGADNDLLRALEPEFNEAIRQDFPVREVYIPWAEAEAEPGVIRSKAVTPPPQEDGTVRVIDIVGLDRQACGGTHLKSTGVARPIKILKIENKGRQNRRMRVGPV